MSSTSSEAQGRRRALSSCTLCLRPSRSMLSPAHLGLFDPPPALCCVVHQGSRLKIQRPIRSGLSNEGVWALPTRTVHFLSLKLRLARARDWPSARLGTTLVSPTARAFVLFVALKQSMRGYWEACGELGLVKRSAQLVLMLRGVRTRRLRAGSSPAGSGRSGGLQNEATVISGRLLAAPSQLCPLRSYDLSSTACWAGLPGTTRLSDPTSTLLGFYPRPIECFACHASPLLPMDVPILQMEDVHVGS